jgi:hypothetical protein
VELNEPDPIAADRRRTARRTLIPEEAACALCGLSDPSGLLLQDDHPLGWQVADDVRIWLCRNCHARQTADRYDHQGGAPAGRRTEPVSVLESLARALISLAVFLQALAQAMVCFAAQLLAMEIGLDEFAPGWRAHVWAT